MGYLLILSKEIETLTDTIHVNVHVYSTAIRTINQENWNQKSISITLEMIRFEKNWEILGEHKVW